MYAGMGVDRFETINGPEDGTEFPVTRAPFDIGSDAGCAVSARLDDEVKPCHARVVAVKQGYRIRSLGGAPVWVNGKRAGRIRSRTARGKDVVKVGRTEFVVHLAEGGLASRSHGVPGESDAAWALRAAARQIFSTFFILRWLYNVRFMRLLLFLAIGAAVLSFFYPPFGQSLGSWLQWGWAWGVYWMQRALLSLRGQG